MACQRYFGTATKANRIKWRICISLFLLGLALLIAFSVIRSQEYVMLMDCMASDDIVSKYGDSAEHAGDFDWAMQVAMACMRKKS